MNEGYIEVPGGRVWYKITGDGDETPLLCLHGGPGSAHYCLEPLEALGGRRRVIFYDQPGCGNSDRPDNPEDASRLCSREQPVEFIVQVNDFFDRTNRTNSAASQGKAAR